MHFVQVPPTFQNAGFTSLKQRGAEERIGPEACCLPTFKNVGFASGLTSAVQNAQRCFLKLQEISSKMSRISHY